MDTETPLFTSWENVPDDMKTKTALRKMGLKPTKEQQPVAQKRSWTRRGGYVFYDLYNQKEAVPIVVTDAQRDSLKKAREIADKARICSRCGYVDPRLKYRRKYRVKTVSDNLCDDCHARIGAIRTAKDLIEDGNFVILDTETTGLDYPHPVEISVINSNGEPLFHHLIKLPEGVSLSDGAVEIHGITLDVLNDNGVQFEDIKDQLLSAVQGKLIIAYNADFDYGTLYNAGFPSDEHDWFCAMNLYAEYCGTWSDRYGSYRWHSLSSAAFDLGVELKGAHRANADTLTTLGVLQALAKKGNDDE